MRGRTATAGALLLATLLLAPLPGVPASHPGEAPEQRLALVEYFTATWCPPCVQGDLALEAVVDMDDVAVLAYHPLDDDPFGSATIEQRLELYNVSGFPTFVINGGGRLKWPSPPCYGRQRGCGTGQRQRWQGAAFV